ncbi:MAG: hypothetical protein ACYC5K_11695, partial [Saccharofermentanales bacterium]
MLTKQSWMRCADDIMFEVQQTRDEGKETNGLEAEAKAIHSLPAESPAREEMGRAIDIKTKS